MNSFAEVLRIYIAHVCELLLKIMAVLAKVGTLREQLPSVIVDPCLYYCCTTHQALAALCSLCTEGCARTTRSMCVGVCNVIREFIWTTVTPLCAQIRTGFYDLHYLICVITSSTQYHYSQKVLYLQIPWPSLKEICTSQRAMPFDLSLIKSQHTAYIKVH